MQVVTRLRSDSNREDKAEAEGVGDVARRRVGESRTKWMFEVGWAVCREARVLVRRLWVEVIEAEVRCVIFEGCCCA